MSWLFFAFCGPVLWAISTHFDKYLVERYFKHSSAAVLLIFTGLTGLATLPIVGWLFPDALAQPPWTAALMTLAGLCSMGSLLFYLRALQIEEASVVIPFSQAAPVFGYALAYVFLGEVLTTRQMAGGVLIMAGALLVTLKVRAGTFNTRVAGLMMICALLGALGALIFKFFALHTEFWPTTFWMFAGQALFGVTLISVPSYRAELKRQFRANPGALVGINVANEAINLGGTLAMRFAITLAPLSIVQAISGTTAIFVFAFGAIVTLVWPALGREDLSLGNVAQKTASALLVAAGAWLVNAATG